MREEIDLIQLEEAELYVEDVGPEDAPVVVLLHDGPGGSSYALREGIGDDLEDYRVLYLDQRGSGRSSELPAQPRLFTVDALVADLEGLRQHFGLDSWTLLGHGFGAIPALEYARLFAKHSANLILIGPWFNFPWLAGQLYRASLRLRDLPGDLADPPTPQLALEEAFKGFEPKAVFDALMFPNPHGRLEYEWLAESGGILGGDVPGQMFVYNGLWNLDYSQYLLDARPAHVIAGTLDGSSFPHCEQIADLTGGRLELIEGAGHFPWIDEPYAFSEGLKNLLEEQDS
jgi:proline iminopeptidase